ncbi:synaptonemal complex protein 1-like [Mixophyes fleayi]|uniref:synaptonemal complex protein 1-like n=1 Tax=Mixophyes fleayi TaxID=3061075 RepID=UPI003F4E1818
MEQEIPFKIFPLQRLNSCHVSAVKPHTVIGHNSFFQNLKSPTGFENTENINNSDCIAQKVSPVAVIEEKSPEPIGQLYFKLLREAEKIKKWKSAVEVDVNYKEMKLQEKRKMIDAQRKFIQELQFENGSLRLKLEDVVHENEDLVNQSNATRHVCNLLKDTCDRAAEKANMYENEIDETRQMYGDLNNNIERMIMAFEEVRQKSENSRHEIYIQVTQIFPFLTSKLSSEIEWLKAAFPPSLNCHMLLPLTKARGMLHVEITEWILVLIDTGQDSVL